MWNKYCKRFRPQVVDWKGGSLTWKYMLKARDYFDQEIWWQPNSGKSSIMFDNWTQLGALYYYLPISHSNELMEMNIDKLMQDDKWNEGKLRDIFSQEVVDRVINNLQLDQKIEASDYPFLLLSQSGRFTIKTVWKALKNSCISHVYYK